MNQHQLLKKKTSSMMWKTHRRDVTLFQSVQKMTFYSVGTWVHLILVCLTQGGKRWPDKFSESERNIFKNVSVLTWCAPGALRPNKCSRTDISMRWLNSETLSFLQNVLNDCLIHRVRAELPQWRTLLTFNNQRKRGFTGQFHTLRSDLV